MFMERQAGGEDRRRILVVDDTESTRHRLGETLKHYGFTVCEASNGAEALDILKQLSVDAILLDLIMPSMNGWEFRETQLRNPWLASIPTVVVTVKPLAPHERYALRADTVVQKPFVDEDVICALQRVRRPSYLSPSPAIYTTPDGDTLFWSKRGEIACVRHAPDADSEKWNAESWRPLPARIGGRRRRYQCQHCAGHAGPLRRSRH